MLNTISLIDCFLNTREQNTFSGVVSGNKCVQSILGIIDEFWPLCCYFLNSISYFRSSFKRYNILKVVLDSSKELIELFFQ